MSNSITRKDFLLGMAALGAAALLPGCASGGSAGSAAAGTYAPGTYECESMGMGRVNVKVKFDAEAIADVQISAINETSLGMDAAQVLQKEILEAQSVAVDTVAGATMTSNAVREAVANCIAQAKEAAAALPPDDLISPIPTLDPPEAWDYEADIAILGASCAGLVAAARLAESGRKVLIFEKENDVGGTARISSCIQVYGGVAGLFDDDPNVGAFGTPYHDVDVVDWFMRRCEWTADSSLLLNTAISLREVSQWWVDNGANLLCPKNGGWWIYWNNPKDEEHPASTLVGATRNLLNMERDIALENGAEIIYEATGRQLVMEDGRCIGFSAVDKEGKIIYVKGAEAVVLAADGMQRNHPMLEKYEGLAGQVHSGMAKGTGYAVRMGQGAGADMAGFGSFGTNDYHPVKVLDEEFRDENLLPINTSVNDRFQAVLRMPWFRVDKDSRLLPLPTNEKILETQGYLGDLSEPVHYSAAQELARGGSYVVIDGGWKDKALAFTGKEDMGGHNNSSFSTDNELPAPDPYYIPPEWGGTGETLDEGLENAISNGIVQKAETIEELAEKLGLDPSELVQSVNQWNDAVASGKSDPLYAYDPSIMRAIDTPPYYGAFCIPALYGTYCGLKVTPKMEVVNTDGDVIPGLYASFMTAGGLAGVNQVAQCCMGDQIGSAHASGWNVAKAIIGEDYVEV